MYGRNQHNVVKQMLCNQKFLSKKTPNGSFDNVFVVQLAQVMSECDPRTAVS